MADLTLAELLKRPVMREEYDMPDAEGAKLLKAAGAGAGSPFGLSEHILRALAPYLSERHNINAHHAADRLYEMRSEYPSVAGAMSGVVAAVPAALAFGATWPEIPAMLPHAAVVGGSGAAILDSAWPAKKSRRPQAAYPPSGAY